MDFHRLHSENERRFIVPRRRRAQVGIELPYSRTMGSEADRIGLGRGPASTESGGNARAGDATEGSNSLSSALKDKGYEWPTG